MYIINTIAQVFSSINHNTLEYSKNIYDASLLMTQNITKVYLRVNHY